MPMHCCCDAIAGSLTKGDYIDAIVERFCPKPVRYKQVWFKLSDGKPLLLHCQAGAVVITRRSVLADKPALYCWAPVPPNPSKFSPMGVVFTDSDDTPMPEDLPHRALPLPRPLHCFCPPEGQMLCDGRLYPHEVVVAYNQGAQASLGRLRNRWATGGDMGHERHAPGHGHQGPRPACGHVL